MTLPRISETVAYEGHPFNVLGYPVIEDRPHIELSRCPGLYRSRCRLARALADPRLHLCPLG